MYKPKYRYQLIDFLVSQYPDIHRNHWAKMRKKQLYAIYYGTRERVNTGKSDWQRDYDRAVNNEQNLYAQGRLA